MGDVDNIIWRERQRERGGSRAEFLSLDFFHFILDLRVKFVFLGLLFVFVEVLLGSIPS